MKIGYADPPYIGQAKRHYGSEEVDHAELLQRLVSEFPDGWALSCSTPSLVEIGRMLEHVGLSGISGGYRIAAWVKPFAIFKPGVNPAYAWEPVVWAGGRKGAARRGGRKSPTVRDWVSCNITLKKGLSGAKPERFCFWLFELLGMEDGDDFVDLFPGTGAVGAAWEKWKERERG